MAGGASATSGWGASAPGAGWLQAQVAGVSFSHLCHRCQAFLQFFLGLCLRSSSLGSCCCFHCCFSSLLQVSHLCFSCIKPSCLFQGSCCFSSFVRSFCCLCCLAGSFSCSSGCLVGKSFGLLVWLVVPLPRGDLPCCMVAWSASLSSRQLATLLVSLLFFKAAAVPFSRQLLCLFQGSCCAFFKAAVETLFHLPLFKEVRIVIATQNLVVEPRWALNQKAAVTHTSLAMPCPEHVTTLARLQHKTTEETRTGRIKGTAEDQWKTQGTQKG